MKAAVLVVLLGALAPAVARGDDIRLDGFVAGDERDSAGFGDLAGDLGQIMGAKMLGPGSTTGALGFHVGLDISVTNIDEGSNHWQKALDDPGSTLTTLQVQVEKGLPFGFEVGGAVTHLLDTDVWGVGMSLKYAIIEGYRLLPDLAIRGGVSTVLGSRDMSLLITGGDMTVSKDFGAGGVLTITPYAGYSFMFVRASSYVIGTFNGQNLSSSVLDPQNVIRHRGFLGFRVSVTYATLAFEAMLADGVQTFTTRIGAEF